MVKGKGVPVRSPGQPRIMQMRVNDEFVALIDEWRRKQPDIPGRTEAVRRLVNEGLKKSKDR